MTVQDEIEVGEATADFLADTQSSSPMQEQVSFCIVISVVNLFLLKCVRDQSYI